MIVADGAGALQKSFTGAGSYIFPIGDNTSTAEYSPVTVDIASGTFSSAYIAVKVVDAKHPNASATSYISRYWSVAQSGLSSFSATVTGTYVPADIVGTFSDIISARWIDPNWVRYSAPVANTISATSLVSFGDFSGINNLPIITTSLSSLTGFTYLEGLGPSAQQSFTVSGTDLFTNITITPSTKFEVSTTSGVSFVASNLITIPVINGNIGTTTIYTRLKAGLPVSTIVPENIPCTSTGAVTKNVACSGTVTDAPLISPTVTSLTGFVYNFGAGPSIAQSFTVNGSNLLANILLSAPTDYEISLSVSSGYGTSLSLTPSSGSVSTLIYVRLKAGLLISPYVENITLTTTSGITKTVTCDGVVNSPTISVSKFNLAGFIYTFGAGPSAEQTFTTNGTNLTANLILTAPTNFQISLTSGSGFTSSISLTPDLSGNVPTTTIYVRMIAGLAVGIISPVKITATTTGGISQTIACSGQIANVATTISSNGTLNGFIYIVGNGPSIEQEFTISATSLTANVTVTPPASNFEISLTSGSGFVSSPSTLSIPQTGGKVNSVPVYVRLKSGLPVATYSTQNIVLSSTGATNVNVACNGIVVTGPTILAGPTGLESLCPNANVTLTSTSTGITNQTWTGPNGFYSTAQNPALGVVTAANNGTYTVTGSALSGVNLLTNGDFESGNTGFGSSYIFQQVAPPEKGNYWLTINPQDMYPSFCACLPHSGTLQMIVDGATSLGIVAWSQTVAVTPGEDYQFSYWIQTVFNHPNEALLQLYVNGVPIGVATNAPVYGVPWTKFIYNANSGSNSVLQLTLINKSLEPDGNDFALDDFEFQQVFPVSSSVNLTVNPTLAPSLAVSASNNPVYSGSEVVFTATPTNGGVSPTYQWYVDGALISGATGITYTYAPTNGQHVSCIMTSNYPCASPATATNEVIMVVNPLYNYWHGTISTDWGTLGNWTAGFIPAPGNDVVYATVENYGSDAVRDLVLDQDRTIGSLINKTARRLVIPPAKGLRVNNLVTIIPPATDPQTGLPTVLSNLIYIQTSSTLANGSLIFFNAVNSPVQATVEMYSKAWWDLGQIQGNRYNWQYFGIPLRSVVAEPTFYNSYVRKWYETGTTISNHWIKLENSSVLVPFYGYELVQQAPKTFYFQGTLENGNFNSGQLAITSGALYPGQHVFANPYTAAIDIRQLTFGTQTEATVYLYHCGTYNAWLSGGESAPGTSPGQYIAIPKNTAGYGQVPRQVPSMQAMLVKAMTVSAQATFAINYNSVQMYNTDLQRSKAIEDVQAIKKMSTMIDVIGAHSSDRMWIFSDSICTNSFDNGYDGFKLLGSPLTPQIFGIGADGEYQVSAVKDMNNTELGFQAGQDSEYTLTFTHENVESRYSGIYLVDLVENKTIDITASGSKYKFVSDPTASTVKRFKIVTNYYEIKEKKSEIKPIKIFNANGSVFIQNLSSESGELMIYNMSGRFVKRVNFSGNCLTIVEQNLSPGAYVATAVTNSDRFSKRIIVR
ncbi:MAG: T9SS type A sorting domain-containing protein [Paludibacter sp.]